MGARHALHCNIDNALVITNDAEVAVAHSEQNEIGRIDIVLNLQKQYRSYKAGSYMTILTARTFNLVRSVLES